MLISQSSLFAQNLAKQDSSFFIISAIKTVSGEEPEEEFFDVFLKFKHKWKLFSIGSLDIALSKTATDTVASFSYKLAEAGLSLNRGFGAYENSENPQRQFFYGAQLKIFDTVSYWGVHLGSMELDASPFHTSYFSIGYLRRLFKADAAENISSDIKEQRHNFFIEFGIRSKNNVPVPVIDALRIKAGILIPTWFWNDDPEPVADDVKTRIVLEIPIKGVHCF